MRLADSAVRRRGHVWLLLGAFLLGCHGRGPVGAEADAVYVAAYGYMVQYRTHFFPVAVDQVCLDGPDGRRMAWRMHASYMRVRADCPYTTPGWVPADRGQDSVPVISLARGEPGAMWTDSAVTPFRMRILDAKGLRRESYAAMLWRRLHARPNEAGVVIRYADARVQSAEFICELYRTRGGWGIERCVLLDVQLRGRQAMNMEDVRGCWHLAWRPMHEEETAGLPAAVDLSTDPDSGDSYWPEYRVTTAPDAADSTSAVWRMARGSGRWRWRLQGDQIVFLGAGSTIEGISATLVPDPVNGGLRGVAIHWDDAGRPSITDPMWQVEGRRVPCGPAAKQGEPGWAGEVR
jgi:hypothetical protein